MKHIVDQFYEAVRTSDVPILKGLIADRFCLICPTRDHVLSGAHQGKHRFFEDVLPHVFGSVNPDEITFCAAHQIVADSGDVVITMAQNSGLARSGNQYDQIYLHVFKVRDRQIHAFIEGFDTALANHALWNGFDALTPDEPAALSNLQRFADA